MRHSRLGRTRGPHLRCPISTLKKEAACPSSRRYPPGRLHGVTFATPTVAITDRCESLRSYLTEHLCQCRYAHCVLWPSDQLTCSPYFLRSTSVLILSHKLEACSCDIASQWIRYSIRTKIEETRCRIKWILLLYSIQAPRHLNVGLVFGKLF